MIIDCETCAVRGLACGDCVIGVLLSTPVVPAADPAAGRVDEVPPGASTVHFDAAERRAIDLLAAQGLIPRLRLVAPSPRRVSTVGDTAGRERDAG